MEAELHEVAAQYGTPFSLIDVATMAARVAETRMGLGFPVDVLFAMKANPSRVLLRELLGVVDGLDVASEGELSAALEVGYAGPRLSLAGPAKPIETLELAGASEAWVSLESFGELERVARLGPRGQLLVRVNPRVPDLAYPLRVGGMPSPFGIDEAQLPEFLTRARDLGVDLRGVHVFAGAQARSARGVARSILRTLELAASLSRHVSVSRIGLGGGFGIAEREGESELSLPSVRSAIDRDRVRLALELMPTARVALELGRFLVGPAGVYVARVIDVRISRGERFTVLDGGMNHQLFSTALYGPNRARRVTALSDRPPVRTHVVGPLCTPLDVLARDVELPELSPGDLVALPSAGAYGMTASPALFLGHRTPIELLKTSAGVSIARHAVDPTKLGHPEDSRGR
ncbi:MAG: pyridoxal-dependent decarboxylase, exosortase A system-associated [Deltaproteobacteria bacterium]|nr:pyridoxal-dependent decarboxylase, exosortase A system-associated [Deltaproteobacteria bacterium]